MERIGHVLQSVWLMSKCGSGFRVGRVCLSVCVSQSLVLSLVGTFGTPFFLEMSLG